MPNSDPALPVLTILTPAWNRRHLLPRLYRSLVGQEVPDGTFEWLVADDGSTDGTEDYLRSLVPDAPFPIRVIRQENGGKHRALNRAARELCSPWVLVVDSDDWLLPGGMKRALADIAQYDDPAVLAIIAPLKIAGRMVNGPSAEVRGVDFATWLHRHARGDTSMILRRSVLQNFPFPEFTGEKFVSEAAVYARAFRDGGICISPNQIAGAEYQPDGLSSRSLQLRAANPFGALATYGHMRDARPTGFDRIRIQLNYHRFFWHAQAAGKRPAANGFSRSLFWLLPAWPLWLRDRRRLSRKSTHGR